MIDIKKIKQAALAATPGPWVSDYEDTDASLLDPDEYIDISIWQGKAFDGKFINNIAFDNCIANATHIATANPSAVLELIARLEDAEKVAAKFSSIKLLGRVNSHGDVIWFAENPHAFQPCTELYAMKES